MADLWIIYIEIVILLAYFFLLAEAMCLKLQGNFLALILCYTFQEFNKAIPHEGK